MKQKEEIFCLVFYLFAYETRNIDFNAVRMFSIEGEILVIVGYPEGFCEVDRSQNETLSIPYPICLLLRSSHKTGFSEVLMFFSHLCAGKAICD